MSELYINRNYKDTLFKAVFGWEENKANLISLYNAINGTNYTNPDDFKINTLDDVIYLTMKNDLSFMVGQEMNLFEHQSSYNPNLPLRGLLYFSKLYENHITAQRKALYSRSLIKIPAPKFFVIYIGEKKLDDITELKLSSAFEKQDTSGNFEWTATVLNVNEDHNDNLLKNCPPLYDYVKYIRRMKKNLKSGMTTTEAVSEALDWAVKNNLLNGFFVARKSEAINMLLTEFNQEDYDRIRFDDGIAEGRELQRQEDEKIIADHKNTIAEKDAENRRLMDEIARLKQLLK